MDASRILAEILAISSDGVVVVDEEQRILLFSRAAESIFGRGADEMCGAPLDLLLPEEERERHREHVRAFVESRNAARLMGERAEIVGLRKNGERFPAEASIARLDVDGRRYFAAVVRDVSERMAPARGQELLRQQVAREAAETTAARFRFLAEAGHVLASSLEIEETLRSLARLAVPRIADWCAIDLIQPGGRMRRLEVSHSDPEWERIARDAHERYPPDPSRPDSYTAAIRRGEPVLVPEVSDALLVELARSDEHLALLRRAGFRSGMAVPLQARGQLVGVITLATAESGRSLGTDDLDLARSLAERAALAIDNGRLLEEARSAARAREEAVATVSHDLRSPLNTVSMNVALLRDGISEEEREQSVERIERAAQGMRRMIRDLLDVTRLEGGAVEIRTEVVRVEPLLAEACELAEAEAAGRSVTLVREVDPALRALADRDRIVQVLVNLLDNAVRHAEPRDAIRVAARAAGERVLFTVTDRGPGVPADLAQHVFRRFWQAEPAGRGGAGLGLAIARRLVELHGGEIWLEHPPEGGARFCFTLEGDRRPDP